MHIETWIVRTLVGEEWGFIKRLILDSTTRQISHADVIVAGTGRIIRIPWDHLDPQHEGFKLNASQLDFDDITRTPVPENLTSGVAMELWP